MHDESLAETISEKDYISANYLIIIRLLYTRANACISAGLDSFARRCGYIPFLSPRPRTRRDDDGQKSLMLYARAGVFSVSLFTILFGYCTRETGCDFPSFLRAVNDASKRARLFRGAVIDLMCLSLRFEVIVETF